MGSNPVIMLRFDVAAQQPVIWNNPFWSDRMDEMHDQNVETGIGPMNLHFHIYDVILERGSAWNRSLVVCQQLFYRLYLRIGNLLFSSSSVGREAVRVQSVIQAIWPVNIIESVSWHVQMLFLSVWHLKKKFTHYLDLLNTLGRVHFIRFHKSVKYCVHIDN